MWAHASEKSITPNALMAIIRLISKNELAPSLLPAGGEVVGM
jgi:hypothetical protein